MKTLKKEWSNRTGLDAISALCAIAAAVSVVLTLANYAFRAGGG